MSLKQRDTINESTKMELEPFKSNEPAAKKQQRESLDVIPNAGPMIISPVVRKNRAGAKSAKTEISFKMFCLTQVN